MCSAQDSTSSWLVTMLTNSSDDRVFKPNQGQWVIKSLPHESFGNEEDGENRNLPEIYVKEPVLGPEKEGTNSKIYYLRNGILYCKTSSPGRSKENSSWLVSRSKH